MIPTFFKIIKSQPSVLRFCLLPLYRIFCPHSLTVHKLRVPRLNISIEIWNELVFFMRHTSSEVSKSLLCLLDESQVSLWNQDVAHWKHTKSSKFLGSIEDNRRETTWHFRVETYFDSSLNFILRFDKKIQHFFSVNDGLSEVSHKSNESGVPFIRNFSEGSWPTGHKYLPDPILKSL